MTKWLRWYFVRWNYLQHWNTTFQLELWVVIIHFWLKYWVLELLPNAIFIRAIINLISPLFFRRNTRVCCKMYIWFLFCHTGSKANRSTWSILVCKSYLKQSKTRSSNWRGRWIAIVKYLRECHWSFVGMKRLVASGIGIKKMELHYLYMPHFWLLAFLVLVITLCQLTVPTMQIYPCWNQATRHHPWIRRHTYMHRPSNRNLLKILQIWSVRRRQILQPWRKSWERVSM